MRRQKKKIALADLQYLYGVKKIYLNHSLVSVAARLIEMGHQAKLVDFNIDEYDDAGVQELFSESDAIGVSLLGAPYIPNAIEFAQKAQNDFPNKSMAIGGQVIEHISRQGFKKLFPMPNIRQIANNDDFAEWIGEGRAIPDTLEVSCVPAWKQIGKEKLRIYLQNEMTLETDQGCPYNCKFCAARKAQKQRFKNLNIFESDIGFLAGQAQKFDINQLEFYASSLDFCLDGKKMSERLLILLKTQQDTGVQINVRGLTSMPAFLRSCELEGFPELLRQTVYCLGFGWDGNEIVWRRENKRHNKPNQLQECVNLCRELGIKAEILMVMGFPEDTPQILWEYAKTAIRYSQYKHVIVRPYFAKTFIPGNNGWTPEIEKIMVAEPRKFYNLDYSALGSPLTHPCWWQRWISNLSYLSIIGLLYPIGKCGTLPLLPQGERGLYGKTAEFVNRIMPSDK